MRGGKRAGAGRPPGAKSKATKAAVAKAEAAGMLPHEFLCAVSQGQTIDGHAPTFNERLDAAKAAAPFYAARLSDVNNRLSGNVGYTPVSVAERDPIDAVDATIGATVPRDPPPSRH